MIRIQMVCGNEGRGEGWDVGGGGWGGGVGGGGTWEEWEVMGGVGSGGEGWGVGGSRTGV